MTAQTSEHGGLVYGLASEGDGAGDFVSAAVTREVVVNGLNHLLDSAGQVIVCFSVESADEVEHTSPPTDEVTKIGGCDWPFPLRVRAGDESSFRLVVSLRGGLSAAGTATFRLIVRSSVTTDVNATPNDPASFAQTNIAEVSTSTPGGEELEAVIYLNAAQVRRMPYYAIASEDGTGDPSSAFYIPATFQIWAKSSSGSAAPRVLSLTVIEYPGER